MNKFSYPKRQEVSTQTKLLASALFIVSVSAMLYGGGRMSEANTLRYENSQIAGVVQQIIGFNRGFPILAINGQRTYINHLPPAFGKYILPGDSVCKHRGEFTVTSYRKINNCTEVITWQYGIVNGYIQPDIRTEKRCR